ncbi:MAG TPA: SpoIIE family protein phosphatase [Thermoanaerobaculia bacterium]|jgi:sigma-B regulation protein RsbU (phosphoserine phosphatase)|nr:SpoIIE family protein phosphatase [Thermoanaerobaculia bacterium]HPA52849.1 SpoIIE family protein phosphatase [Thermoanaerobaculia bacterium]HQN06088.1 SpoIIE family protein phosphatase [Thermoanaerobaculia bacterium]HQP87056.1 SpoIIE family protein phosphatase [Thermoanaerobaculia bacterium]
MRADVPGAHALLATLDPASAGTALLEPILEALLKGAGGARGLALDAGARCHPAARGLDPLPSELAGLAASLARGSAHVASYDQELLVRVFGTDPPEGEPPFDPRVVPLTVGDETLAWVALERSPADPVGFASVAAHAASLLAWVRMSEKVREADFELKYRVWELESIYDVGLSIARTLDLESLADEILMKSVSLLNARSGTLVVRPGGPADGGNAVFVRSFGTPLVEPGSVEEPDGAVLVCNRREDRPASLAGAPAEKLLAVPISSEGRPLGLLVVADKENRQGGIDDFGPADVRILSLFGNQAAIALENARLHREAVEKEKMEREIEIAASIQRAILPTTLPAVSGILIAAGNRPTRQVGGDFYDVYPLPDGRVAFCVADVAGKGIPAALLVSTVHACIHLLVEAGASDLTALVARTNRHLARFSSTRKFVTLFLAVYDPSDRSLRYVNAGHNPGIRISAAGTELLPSGGVPIGMFESATQTESRLFLSPGDLVVLYSDGITEAVDAKDEEFGMERLTRLLESGRALPPNVLKDRIFAAVEGFTRGVPQYDDQTVLVARPT